MADDPARASIRLRFGDALRATFCRHDVLAGLIAGVFFAFSSFVMPALAKLPAVVPLAPSCATPRLADAGHAGNCPILAARRQAWELH